MITNQRQGKENMPFSKETIQSVWEKGEIVADYDAKRFRKDEGGSWIRRWGYGAGDVKLGWKIHHIIPESDGGGNELSNLRPLQWNNR